MKLNSSNGKRPFFSIIIPTYNRAKFLGIAIESVLYQTFTDFELIIVDDGSRDNTKELIKKNYERLLSSNKLRYIYQPHKGVSFARNNGINYARGEFICFLDSDDRFRTQKLQVTYKYIKKYQNYKVFHTEEIWYRNGSVLAQKIYHKKPHGFVFKTAVKLCCISISTAAISQDIFKKIGGFDENLDACEDYDFWLRTTAQFPVYLIRQYLTIKEGGHTNQQSKKYPAMDRFRIQSLVKILDTLQLTREDYACAVAELRNKCYIYMSGAKKRKKTKEVAFYKNLINKYV
ncbi:MAG: glycosyltransferase [Candidatus Omnitrophota bacterium]|nr:MAG: glycosyltransferase [Candidatus Omnitrophota bacterium]